MNVVIRTDASALIGTGHLVRCLTLADNLRAADAGVTFVCREHRGHLCELLKSRGYPVIRLPAPEQVDLSAETDDDYAAWLAVSWQRDADQTAAAIRSLGSIPDWLVVDHYGLDGKWESHLRALVRQIMVTDDLAGRVHDCDILLDQNAHIDQDMRYDKLVPATCRRLLGPTYALLRPEFHIARSLRRQKDRARRLLIFFGGVDKANLAGQVLEVLTQLSGRDFSIDLIAGWSNPHREKLRKSCCSVSSATFYSHVENMAEMMFQAGLALGAAGTTTWERCAVGLPAVVVAAAENQVAIGEAVNRLGVGRYLGRASQVSFQMMVEESMSLLNDQDRLTAMRQAGLDLVDGLGCQRVCSIMADTI